MNNPIRAVIFDLDNTLTDRPSSIRRYAEKFFSDFRSMMTTGVHAEDVHRVIQAGDGGGYRPKEALFQEIQENISWVDLPDQSTIAEHWYRMSPLCMILRPGTQCTLTTLLRRGFTLGIITNGKTHVQNATIDATHIRPFFASIVISEESGVRKPDPAIFELMLSALNVRSDQAAYIGDNPESDIQGAHNAGLHSIWFTDGSEWSAGLRLPSHQISRIPQLLELL